MLDDNARLMIILTELGGTAALALTEDAVEVAQVVETATIAYLRNRVGAVDELPASIAESQVDDVIAEVTACMELEETAERRGTHACNVGQLGQSDLILVVGIDITLHLLDATAVARDLDLGKAAGSKGACTVVLGELIEDGQELHEGVKAVLDLTERVELLIDVHDGVHGEAESLAGLEHHLLHRIEGIAGEDATFGEIDVELDRNLTDIIAGALILLPDVLQVGAGDEHQVVFANHLVGIAHDATHTLGMLHEIEFVDLVVMDGIGKLLLSPISDVEHILTHQRRDLMNDLTLNHIFSSFRMSLMR